MTKIIFILRHAQSAGKQSSQRDYDRILTPQGETEARARGKIFSEKNYFPDLILCSASARTRQTLALFNESNILSPEKIEFREDLYDALMVHLLDIIHELPDDINKVMYIGHNPGLSLFASDLCANFTDLGTSQLVAYEFNTKSWKDLSGPGKEILNLK
jgi:phosphohistidine phosphatase